MDTKEFYENLAETHDAESIAFATGRRKYIAHDDRYEQMLALLNREFGQKSGLQILDVGCGDGVYEKLMNKEIADKNSFYGLDISDLQRQKSSEVFKELKSMDFDHDPIPYEDARFDYVICSEVLEHLFYPDMIISQIKRVLKPGGVVIITVPNLSSIQNRLALLFFGTSPFFDYLQNKQHIRYYSKRTLLEMFAGYKVIRQVGINSMMFERYIFPVRIILPYCIQRAVNFLLPSLGGGLCLVFKKPE